MKSFSEICQELDARHPGKLRTVRTWGETTTTVSLYTKPTGDDGLKGVRLMSETDGVMHIDNDALVDHLGESWPFED